MIRTADENEIEIRYSGQAASAAGISAERIPLKSGTMEIVLEQLVHRHAGLAPFLNTTSDAPARAVVIFVNEQQIDRREAPELRIGDRLLILAPMAGG